MTKSEARTLGRDSWVLVPMLLHLALLLSFAGAGAYRATKVLVDPGLPTLRPAPLKLAPLYDRPAVVTDAQLRRVLSRLRPRVPNGRVRIGPVDHYLRMWGAGARFEDPELLSSNDMLALLTDHRRFARVFGDATRPLLIDTNGGIRIRTSEDDAGSPHVDHLLASLLEIGIPLDFPIATPNRTATLRAIAEQSLRDFSLNQPEYEWSALSYALIVSPARDWYTSEGQQMTFDRLAQRLMREALPRGVDWGTHRLYSLVAILRVDEMNPAQGRARILTNEVRRRATAYLREVTAAFARHQHADGFWNGDWARATAVTSEPTQRVSDRFPDRLIVTGHALEWWALAPPKLLPPDETLVAAGQWLVRTIDRLTPEELIRYQSFLSHAGRALALWRGQVPGDVMATER